MKIHDPEWMPWRVLKRDEVTGVNPWSQNMEEGKLQLRTFNLLVALLFNYTSVAPYKIEPRAKDHDEGDNLIYHVQRPKMAVGK